VSASGADALAERVYRRDGERPVSAPAPSLYNERMSQFAIILRVRTRGRGLYEFTGDLAEWVDAHQLETGLLTLFCRHTSASLLIQENAAPAVRDDIEAFFEVLAPEDKGRYSHDDEGPDDMPAHIRAALTNVSLSIPIVDGRLALGTWQGVYLFEHRRAPHLREVAAHLLGP
jgi:secondary thiamine-phosphate synthase enzyme